MECVIPEIKEWQNHPLSSIYPFVFLDTIYYKEKDDGHIISRTVYAVLGLGVGGIKDIVGIG